MRHLLAVIFTTLLLCAGGCSPFVDGYTFVPRPAVVDVIRKDNQQKPLTVLATAVGVRRADRREQLPESIEVRLRFENNGPAHTSFDPRTLQLTTGALIQFALPIVRPPNPIELDPGQSAGLTCWFPFPPGRYYGDTDLDSLRLRWMVKIGDETVPESVGFNRLRIVYYDPYWGPPPPATFTIWF